MNQFRSRKKIRMDGYDYSNNGHYYVTICTDNREYVFGDIVNNEMALSRQGEIAYSVWFDLPNHHSDIELDAFIIMPNHIPGHINRLSHVR